MKKMGLLLIMALLITCFSGITAFASNNIDTPGVNMVKFETYEITDKNVLFEKAQNNISDKSVGKATVQIKNNDKMKSETYSTTQLLKVEEDTTTNNVSKTYVTNSFVIVQDEEEIENTALTTAVSPLATIPGTMTKVKWDTTTGVKATATIYWTEYENYQGTPLTYYKLNKAVGSWYQADTQIIIFNREVKLANSGATVSGGYLYQVTPWKAYTTNSFTYSANTSWQPVSNVTLFDFGVLMNCDLKRSSGSAWALDLAVKL